MQNKGNRTNRERTEATRGALLAAARAAFVEKGYAATSTPEIVAAAGITRGALYHHFVDKRDLFRAVLEDEARTVAAEIERAAPSTRSARKALIAGSKAYLDAMTVPGRTRLLLIDGPAVLGSAEIFALDEAHAGRTLREGLQAAMGERMTPPATVDAFAMLLSAAFDRAAIAIDAGSDAAAIRAVMMRLVERTLDPS